MCHGGMHLIAQILLVLDLPNTSECWLFGHFERGIILCIFFFLFFLIAGYAGIPYDMFVCASPTSAISIFLCPKILYFCKMHNFLLIFLHQLLMIILPLSRDGILLAVKEVSLLDQGSQGNESVSQLEQVRLVYILFCCNILVLSTDIQSLIKKKVLTYNLNNIPGLESTLILLFHIWNFLPRFSFHHLCFLFRRLLF